MTLEELAKAVNTSRQQIHRYETGIIQNIPTEMVEKLAAALCVDPAYLMGWEESSSPNPYGIPGIEPLPEMVEIPLLGTIACGTPLLAVENIDEHIQAPKTFHASFALRCKGDSMVNARIHDGDVVYIRQQPDVENGQIAAVLIDNEATLKRVYKQDGLVTLAPENPQYPPLVYVGEDINNMRILGLAVGFSSAIE